MVAAVPGYHPRNVHPFKISSPVIARLALFAGLALASSGCASAGQFVWFYDVPPTAWGAGPGEYVIGVGDSVTVRVYEQENLSGVFKIRRDGRIALPLAGEVVAAGKRPSDFSKEIEAKLKEFVVTPRVTVNVETSQPISVAAVGEFGKAGTITLDPPARLIDAIAQAGGPSNYADKSRIFVLRQFPTFQRIRFEYQAILHNDGRAAEFPLRTGDVLVAE